MNKMNNKLIQIGLVICLALSVAGCRPTLSPELGPKCHASAPCKKPTCKNRACKKANACSKCKKTTCKCKQASKKIYCGNNPNAPYEVCGNPTEMVPMSQIKQNILTASGMNENDGAIGILRAQSLRETALSIGARGGLAERARRINATLLNYEPLLARIFQFYGMLLDDNILPPVLIEGRNTLSLAGNDAIRIADRNYKIAAQARFVTAPPTWREYLWMSYDPPELPDRSLLPRSKPERIMWERDIEDGWQAGLKQADLIFNENINRLVRDFSGMILYRQLLAQNMVSSPFVAKMDMGITGNGNDMSINDKVLRITAFPQLQTESEGWKTEIHLYE